MDDSVVLAAPLFAGLDPEEARPLLATMATVRLTRGDVLFNEGERGDRLFIISEGKIARSAFLGRPPREPDGDPRPGRDVRRACRSSTQGPAR